MMAYLPVEFSTLVVLECNMHCEKLRREDANLEPPPKATDSASTPLRHGPSRLGWSILNGPPDSGDC